QSRTAPPIHGVVETILYAEDLPRTAAFYREVIGLAPMTGHEGRFQSFDAGANRVLLLFKRGATLTPQAVETGRVLRRHHRDGPQHIAFGINAGDYDGWCAWLRARGIAIESETKWARGGRSVYFRDPDQHLVELVTPGIWPNY